MDLNLNIRLADLNDTQRIVEIYNQGIRNRNNAILDDIILESYIKEFEKRNMIEYPIYVAEIDNTIYGWISVSPYRANRRAYKGSKEVSFYLDETSLGKGIGTNLLRYVIDNRSDIGFHTLFAILVANNERSIKLLKKFDFKLWGLMPKVLEMDKVLKDAIIYGRNFE